MLGRGGRCGRGGAVGQSRMTVRCDAQSIPGDGDGVAMGVHKLWHATASLFQRHCTAALGALLRGLWCSGDAVGFSGCPPHLPQSSCWWQRAAPGAPDVLLVTALQSGHWRIPPGGEVLLAFRVVPAHAWREAWTAARPPRFGQRRCRHRCCCRADLIAITGAGARERRACARGHIYAAPCYSAQAAGGICCI